MNSHLPSSSATLNSADLSSAASTLSARLARGTLLSSLICFVSLTLSSGMAHGAAGFQSGVAFTSGDHEPIVQLRNKGPVLGILSAGSTLEDAGRGLTVDTIGSASLVRVKKTGRLAVLTAAHVIAGQNPWIEIAGRRVSAKKALIDNDNDVAIVEVGAAKAEPGFEFDGKEIRVTKKLMAEIDRGKIPVVTLAYYLPAHALGFALSPWVDPGVETAYARGIVHAPIVSLNYTGEQIRVYTKVTSGASGSAVFDLREQRVAGLIVQSHYYFSETYLASAEVLNKHFRAFANGKRGGLSKTQWKMHNGLSYRIFEGGIEEANFTNRPTQGILGRPGAGVIGQPSAGVIGQPGKGVVGQPGKGVFGQPGKGVIGQPGKGVFGQPGKGVIGQPERQLIPQSAPQPEAGKPENSRPENLGPEATQPETTKPLPAGSDSTSGATIDSAATESLKPWSESPRAVFSYYQIKPGMVWNGQTVIGLRARAKSSEKKLSGSSMMKDWPAELALLAEAEAFRFMNAQKKNFEFEPITAKVNFIQLLRERLQLRSESPVRLKTTFGPSAVADDMDLKALPDECTVIVSKEDVRIRVKTFARMNRETWQLVPDEIEFSLNRNGSSEAGGEFLPVIETKGLQTGEIYYVDLRQFFFTDLSQLIRPMPDWSPENPPFDLTRFDLANQITTVGFSVRNARSGAEFTYGFNAPEVAHQP